MKILASFLALLLAGCAAKQCPPADNPATHEAYVAAVTDSTYQVQILCASGSGSGSAVALENRDGFTYLATAAHVVDGEDCHFTAGGRLLEVIATDADFDIAIVRAFPPFPVRKVEAARVYMGLPITTVGYPSQPYTGSTSLQITTGEVAAFVSLRYKISSPGYFGSSGGPVFDKEGHLVGLLVELIQKNGVTMPGEWFATPAWRIYEMY